MTPLQNYLKNQFSAAASSALASENDELIHKQALDLALKDSLFVQTANACSERNFPNGSKPIGGYVSNGVSRIANVDLVNKVRCSYVLLAIDVYLAATTRKQTAGNRSNPHAIN